MRCCRRKRGQGKDEKKTLKQQFADLAKRLANLVSSIAALVKNVKEFDRLVEEATEAWNKDDTKCKSTLAVNKEYALERDRKGSRSRPRLENTTGSTAPLRGLVAVRRPHTGGSAVTVMSVVWLRRSRPK